MILRLLPLLGACALLAACAAQECRPQEPGIHPRDAGTIRGARRYPPVMPEDSPNDALLPQSIIPPRSAGTRP